MPNITAVPTTQSALTELQQKGTSLENFKQLLTNGMGSYVADYLRDQSTAKLLSNLMQSRKQGVWTNRDAGIEKFVNLQFNSGASINEFGQFIDSSGIQQLLLAAGSKLIWYNMSNTVVTNVTTSLPTDHTNNSDPLYPLFPCIREFETIVAGVKLYTIVTHPQLFSAYTIDSSAAWAAFQLNATGDGSTYWGCLDTPIVANKTVYGFPALCEPYLDRMVYTGWPISFQTSPPGGFASPSVYDIIVTNSGKYDTCTLNAPLLATDGVRLQVPAICGRPTALRTIQLNNSSNSQAVLVGCENGVCLIQGTDASNMGLIILTREFGIPSNRAILQIQNDIIFLANDGIRAYSSLVINANLLTSSLSYGLQDYIQKWDQNWLNQSFAVRHRQTKDIQFWMPLLNADGSSTGKVSTSNQAAVFNGTTQYLSHANAASLQVGTGSFTWAGWFTYNGALGGFHALLAKTTDGSTTGDYWLRLFPSGNVFLYVFNGATNASVSSVSALVPGTQYFIVAWYDASANSLNIQINNGPIATATAGITPAVSTAELDIGSEIAGASGFWPGIMQSLGYWKRVLDASEIEILYNNGTPIHYLQLPTVMQSESTSTFVSWWDFHETSGTRKDARSTGNDLTDHNGVATTTNVTDYKPATVNFGMVFNYGSSSPNVQSIPQLNFTPSIREYMTQYSAIEVQDPTNNNLWTMLGGGYNGYIYKHYATQLNDGQALPYVARFPLINCGNDATGFSVRKIHIICEGQGQDFFVNAVFLEMMANGTLIPQNSQQGEFNIVTGQNLETILGQWILGLSAFPGTFVQLCEYEPIGEGRYVELQIFGNDGSNIIDLIGAHYMLSAGGTRR